MDRFSPVAPARIRVLVLPVGRIERSRFSLFLRRLQTEASIIPLANVQQRTQSSDAFLSPQAFRQGSLLYCFSAAVPSEQQLQLSPFELFREPLVVIGVVDVLQGDEGSNQKELENAAVYLKEKHPRVVQRQLVVLSDDEAEISSTSNAIRVANLQRTDDASLRNAVRELSARFLVEFKTYAEALQALPTISTPGQTARSLQRTTSLRESEKRPSSGQSTPIARVSSPTDECSPARKATPLPATSFDQIPSANASSASYSRPESRASNHSVSGKIKDGARSRSQDRFSVQGFGSSTSQEKTRARGKARVGAVLGSVYMMAGHWSEALRLLAEHTAKLRSLSDHLWHAKGLENMMVCMILLAWAGVEFQVPSLCDPVADRSSAANAARIAAETKAATEGTKQQLQMFRLSAAIPESSKLILSLYRSTEGSLELPFLTLAEATIRISKLLATIGSVSGEMGSSVMAQLVKSSYMPSSHGSSLQAFQVSRATLLSKSAIADMLAAALPGIEDGVAVGDHISILAGIASTYALLGLERKKAITIKDLVVRLTGAMMQARKLGAAEMGIHPAASLSADGGSATLLAVVEESLGIDDLFADVSKTYGVDLASSKESDSPSVVENHSFGSSSLKFHLLRELAAFCEASPDPYGVLLLTTSLLRAAGPDSPMNTALDSATNALTREEQMHLATMISRTVNVSKHLGLKDAQAVYWDPFLLRGLEILPPSDQKAVIDRTKLVPSSTSVGPFLYDPNASRPGTATDVEPKSLLVLDEPSTCTILLQNPFDIPVDIEELELVTDGVDLSSRHEPVTLGPLRFQQVPLMVTPLSVGSTKITGCRIKMQNCFPQTYRVVAHPVAVNAPVVVKDLGLSSRSPSNHFYASDRLKGMSSELQTASATVIDALPSLELDGESFLDFSLMLLEGERRSLCVTLHNTGAIPARVFEVADTQNVLRLKSQLPPDQGVELSSKTVIEPGKKVKFSFEVQGKAGLSRTKANFFYCTADIADVKYARVVSMSLDMTVNAALQVHNLEVAESTTSKTDELLVSFDVRNAWPKSISYECFHDASALLMPDADGLPSRKGHLVPGEIRRVYLNVAHSVGSLKYEDDVAVVRSSFLGRLQIKWEVDDRSGVLDTQGLSLSPASLSLVRGLPVHVTVDLLPPAKSSVAGVSIGSFVSVRIEVLNRTQQRIGPLSVFLSPHTSGMEHNDRNIAVAGTLHRIVPPLRSSEKCDVDFVVCPLLAGLMELEAVTRPAPFAQRDEVWTSRRTISVLVSNLK